MCSSLIRHVLISLKSVFEGFQQGKAVQGNTVCRMGQKFSPLYDARPEAFFIFAEQFPKDNSLLIL